MTEELPEGWAAVKLGTVIEFHYGKGLPAKARHSGSVRVFGSNGVVGDHDEAATRAPAIIIGRKGSVGEVHFSNERCWPIDTTYFVDTFGPFEPRFLAELLRSMDLAKYESSTALPGISRGDVYDLSVSVAPFAEQQRIIQGIEALLSQVKAAKSRLAEVPLILKRFRQAVLAAACSGRLTEEWRSADKSQTDAHDYLGRRCGIQVFAKAENSGYVLPERWAWIHFGALISTLRMGTTVPPQREVTEFPVLRSSSVRPGTVDFADVRYLAAEDSANDDYFLRDGDLIFTRLSGSLDYVANCAQVRGLNGRRIQYPDRIFRACLKDDSWGAYIELCFASAPLRGLLMASAKSSAGHQRISMDALTRFLIPFPPPEEQEDIVRRVRGLLALADRIQKRAQIVTGRAESLPRAIRAKAFRGELVPTEAELARAEGRDYETAEELLRRIAKTRAPAESSRKRRGKAGAR